MNDQDEREDDLRALTARLGLSIRRIELVNRALTHASTSTKAADPQQNYESLEFLGDAVLGMAVADYLYAHIPDRTPGEYSRMRASVVNRRTLARVATRLELAPAIRLGKGEELAGGRRRKALLADCLEAFIAAIYLDQGWETAQEFVARVLADELEAVRKADQLWDFKSRLQNLCQAEHIALPKFAVVETKGPDHRKQFEVEVRLRGKVAGRGVGMTKKEAEQHAAREALEAEGLLVGKAGTRKARPKSTKKEK